VERASLPENPFRQLVAAVSLGIVDGRVLLDLDYSEDSTAEVDLNLVGLDGGGIIEVQGTAERAPFAPASLTRMIELGSAAIGDLLRAQHEALRG
jgi:ribonuclease PH